MLDAARLRFAAHRPILCTAKLWGLKNLAIAYTAVWSRSDPRRRKARAIALQGVATLLVVFVGALGVSSDSGLRKLVEHWVDIHALFGLLLCALVVTDFRWRLTYHRTAHPAEFRDLSRHLSRIVYLSLYLVIGAKQVMGIVNWISRGNGQESIAFGADACASVNCAIFGPTQDLRAILLYGIVTLVLIRALAFSFSLRALRTDAHAKGRQPILPDIK